jgi:hypothetical protein
MPPLLLPFAAQLLLAVAAFFLAPRIARARKAVWATVAALSLATMFLWPLMRVFPVEPIRLLGAPAVACIELTGLAVPAVLFFGVASRHVPRKNDARAILLLTVAAAIYFVRAGWWMVIPGGGVPDLGPTRIGPDNICRQSTGYTCVAASMVTMLRAFDIPAEETEMARLAFTQVNAGATDSRTLWALQRKLAGTGLVPAYQRLDRASLLAVPKPCLVQIDWSFFVSHMVPVLDATATEVTLGDPLTGRRSLPMSDFLAVWKGTAISLRRN